MRYNDPLRHVLEILAYVKRATSRTTVTRYNDPLRHVLKILAYFKHSTSLRTVTRYNDPLRHVVTIIAYFKCPMSQTTVTRFDISLRHTGKEFYLYVNCTVSDFLFIQMQPNYFELLHQNRTSWSLLHQENVWEFSLVFIKLYRFASFGSQVILMYAICECPVIIVGEEVFFSFSIKSPL